MTAYEFGLWMAEYARNPWGEMREDLRAAVVAKTVADYAGKVRKGEPASLSEFLLRFGSDEKEVEEVEEPDPIDHFKNLGA